MKKKQDKRRKAGTGSVKRHGKGWQLKFDVTTGGKRVTRYVTYHCDTEEEAELHLRELLLKRDKGTLLDPTKATVSEYIVAFRDSAVTLSPKTIERYREIAQHQIGAFIGNIKLAKLDADRIGAWHVELIQAGLAPRTIRHSHRLLHQVMSRAVIRGKLVSNEAAKCKPPTVGRAKDRGVRREAASRAPWPG